MNPINEKRDYVAFYENIPAGTPTAPPQYAIYSAPIDSLPLVQTSSPPPPRTFGNGDESHRSSEPEPPSYIECAVLTKNEVRDALEDYILADRCSMGSLLQDINISNIQSKPTYRYTIDTFSESRTFISVNEPSKQPPTGTSSVPRFDKWSFPVVPPIAFANASTLGEVSGSSEVKDCNHCLTQGWLICGSCDRKGFVSCTWCKQTGRKSGEKCSRCTGGKQFCRRCDSGRIRCEECKGHKYVRHWKNIQIQWKAEKKSFESPRGNVPKKLLEKACSGGIILNERYSGNQARPIAWERDAAVTAAAEKLFRQCCSIQNENTKILEFRQQIEVIPVVEANFELWCDTGKFYVVGMDRKVYFPQGNPTKCSIL